MTSRAEAAGKETLIVKPRGEAKKKLNSDGKATVNPKVTFTPDGSEPPHRAQARSS